MENPSFFLEGVFHEKNELQDFEGPLSLILMLLSKNKIEIRDVSISEILDQYLDYLDRMQSMDLEIASEFVQMAAHLLYIKSRTLLASEEEEVSELEILLQSLEQLKCKDVFASVQQVVPALRSASQVGSLYFSKMPEPLPKVGREYEYRHEPVDLFQALYHVFSRSGRPVDVSESIVSAMPKRIVFSVREKSRQMIDQLRSGPMSLETLYRNCASRSEVVATFISILELCSMGNLRVDRLENGAMVEFVGGDTEEILEQIEE